MTEEAEREGTPWYHHFWPWFIVLLMLVSMSSAVATVFLAVNGADPVVSTEWYAEGVDINTRLERQARAKALGLSGTLDFAAAPGRARLHLDGDATEQLPAVRLHLSHATQDARDVTLRLDRVAPGVFEGDAPADLAGRWYAAVEPGAVETPSVAGTELDWRLTSMFRLPSRHPITFGEEG